MHPRNRYEGNVHGTHGYFVLFLAVTLSVLDIIALGSRLIAFVRAIKSGDQRFTWSSVWNTTILGKDASPLGSSAEYTNLVVDVDEDEYEETELKAAMADSDQLGSSRQPHGSHSPPKAVNFDEEYSAQTIEWLPHTPVSDRTAVSGRYHARHHSVHSDDTLQDAVSQMNEQKPWYKWVGFAIFATLERVLVFAGFMQLLTGVVVYTGGCRGDHVNVCLAHLIKGGIFWCYGLVTFARFLGSFSELGWAWNRIPVAHRKNVPTAEFVESFVVFLYGISNTWMERFGAEPGDPYTARQVQHISIAVSPPFGGSCHQSPFLMNLRTLSLSGHVLVRRFGWYGSRVQKVQTMARRRFPRLPVQIQQNSFHSRSRFRCRTAFVYRLVQPFPSYLYRYHWGCNGRPFPTIRLSSSNPRFVG